MKRAAAAVITITALMPLWLVGAVIGFVKIGISVGMDDGIKFVGDTLQRWWNE